MAWKRRTVAVRINREVLALLGSSGPRDVSTLLRAHRECERRVEALMNNLEAARRDLEVALTTRRTLEERYESLRTDHMELLAERKRLEERLQNLRRRSMEPRGEGLDGRVLNDERPRARRRADAPG